MSGYHSSRSESKPRRYTRRSRSVPISAPVSTPPKMPTSEYGVLILAPRKPRIQPPEPRIVCNKADPVFWHNYYGRTPSWLRDYRSYYLDSPYSQWWYDPDAYKNYQRSRPDPYLDRTDSQAWKLTLDPYFDNRNLWRYASKQRQYRAEDNALAMKLYYDRLITFDDLQRNWLSKRTWAKKTNKKWWNEVGMTHRFVPATYRFPARQFYSWDY